MVYVVMGVSGSGKTVVGKALAAKLGLPFHDGDDFHPPANVAKMSAGIPLNDADREPWLRTLAGKIREWNAAGGAVLACSALKESYRQQLREGGDVRFIFLDVPKQLLAERLRGRTGHFMPVTLLDSQLATLEIPEDAIRVSDTATIDETVAKIVAAIKTSGR
ncbi:MAG TPA: gluconokinase [Verrucomicrobiae bacterium]|nr:gluconokinase [Verrucomicrobiae bacterium]